MEILLDSHLPVGASHHEKLVVIDDDVAYCGGVDLTVRRWDVAASLSSGSRPSAC